MLDSLPAMSLILFWGMVALSVIVAGLVVFAIGRTSGAGVGKRAALVTVCWLGLTGCLGASGYLDAWAPPPLALLLALLLAFLAWAARRPWTERLGDLPLKILVGFQALLGSKPGNASM